MFKLSYTMAMVILLSACGGNGGDSKLPSSNSTPTTSPTSTVISSHPSISSSASQISSSSVTSIQVNLSVISNSSSSNISIIAISPNFSLESSSSSINSSSSSPPNEFSIIFSDFVSGWQGDNGGEITYVTEGVRFEGSADGEGAITDLGVSIDDGFVVNFVINVSDEYKTSGANLQLFLQNKILEQPNEYSCWVNNADLIVGIDQVVSCAIGDNFLNQMSDVKAGIRAKGNLVAGIVLIKNIRVTFPSTAQGSSSSNSSDNGAVISSSKN